jgi:hypothetical protein
MKKLFEQYKNEFLIYEGLITTHPLSSVETILRHKYSINIYKEKNYFNLKFLFDIDLGKALIKLKEILQLTNNLGWFPATMDAYDIKGNYKHLNWDTDREQYYKKAWEPEKEDFKNFKYLITHKYTNIVFVFEAIRDIKDTYGKYLYHATEVKNLDNILKEGLIPKTRSKKSYHPDRIYLSKIPEDLYKYMVDVHKDSKLRAKKVKDITKRFVILQIDTTKIKFYLEIFKDVNFVNKGWYTLNNIPPYSLKIYDTVSF